MSDSARDLLVRGIAAAKGNSKQEAKFYLEWVTRMGDATHDQLADAYRWLAQVVDDPQEKREYLDHALAYNPNDPEARRALALLNGTLKPDDIIDPNKFSQPVSEAPASTQARRFVCTQCGGKMQFAPDATTLECAYCGFKQSLLDLNQSLPIVEEHDFIVALATAKGHSKPTISRIIKCKGCGASFILAPQTISQNCPYCASAYVIEQAEDRELIAPEGVIPFAISQETALQRELEWFRRQGWRLRADPAPPAGVYLPVWTFDVGGEVTWRCRVYRNKQWVVESGTRAVLANDVLVPASHHLSLVLSEEIRQMPLDRLVPYDARYLADFPAETYDVAVSDASIVARSQAFHQVRAKIMHDIFEQYTDLTISPANVIVDSYKLILVPMWVTHYRMENKQYGIVINGCTGNVRAERPRQGVIGWLAHLFGE